MKYSNAETILSPFNQTGGGGGGAINKPEDIRPTEGGTAPRD